MANQSTGTRIASTTTPSWRQFNFFHSFPVDQHPDQQPLLSTPSAISNISQGFGSLILAHLNGLISILNCDFSETRSWSAFPAGRTLLVRATSINGLIVSVGEESSSSLPVLKIWNLRHEDKRTSAPQLLGYSNIQNGNRPHPVTALALTPSLTHLAIGLADGTVLLYRHLDQALLSVVSLANTSRPAPLLPKPKIIYSSPEPITGLGFRLPSSAPAPSYFASASSSEPPPKPPPALRHTSLFIVTTAKVLCYLSSARAAGAGSEPVAMDDLGGSVGCSAMMDNGDLILADDAALYVYGPEGRGACLAYDGAKARLDSWANYLIITSPPLPTGPRADLEQTRLIVFDLQNRFIAHAATFRGTVEHVWAEWGELYVLTGSGELTRLVERPLSEKLSMLYDKDMYVLATNVAKSSGADGSEIAEIHRRFGDHLYQKSDFEGAVQEYIHTIGTVQPSFVVRKFLDAQRISNLTSYLQELHARGVANADHTTLLLNCYTKLKDHAKLDDFIKANERASRDGDDGLPFDLETAIRVCRQAGYYEHALYLAKQYRQDEDYLRIQIEDRGEWADAVRYIRALGSVGAEANLLRYGKPLLANLPEETTELMIDVCCGAKLVPDPSASPTDKPATSYRAYLSPRASAQQTPTLSRPSVQVDDAEASELPQLRQFFAFFIDEPQCFIKFLETVAARRWGERMVLSEDGDGRSADTCVVGVDAKGGVSGPAAVKGEVGCGAEDREAVWGTLLELYLELATGAEREKMERRALCLLKWGADGERLRYEPTQALIVCLTHDFVPGIVLLYERLGMVEDIVRFWIERAQVSPGGDERVEVLSALDKYGEEHPELYPIVLRYLASSSGEDSGLGKVLDEIEQRRIMAPVEVIETLSKEGSVACIGTVKNYLVKQVMDQQGRIESDRGLIDSYRKEISKKSKEMEEIDGKPQVFQLSRCGGCLGTLELPVVHFMCQHSFHQRCLGDREICLKCGGGKEGNEVLKEMMERMKKNKSVRPDEHELFVEEVREAEDPFGYIAGAYSKGFL